MKQETLTIQYLNSAQSELGNLIMTARSISLSSANIVIGRPGMSNLERELTIGDAVLIETPDEGVLEVRLLTTIFASRAEVLISQVSSHASVYIGLTNIDPSNLPFTAAELRRIASSIDSIKQDVQSLNCGPEQLDLILRKLDEMREASQRLGRKDWINFAIGTLMNVIAAATLDRDTAKTLLGMVSKGLSWVFQQLLQWIQ